MPGTGSRSLGAPEQQEPEQPEDVHNAEAEADPREPILDAKRASKESAEDSESQGFAVMCAFAAPLMKFSSDDEGGAVVSFVV